MSDFPRDLEEFLPSDISTGAIAAWARIGRSFDRVNGEALVLRMRSGGQVLLTRPERFEFFRSVPLAREPMRVSAEGGEFRLLVCAIDGRRLVLKLIEEELRPLREVLGSAAEMVGPTPKPPQASITVPPPPRERPSFLRAPESAELEVVRIPLSVRSPVARPSEAPRAPSHPPPAAQERTSRVHSESVHPPAFAAEPAPIVRSARDTEALRASFRHHFDQGALDEAGLLARALVHLGIADPMEERLARLQPQTPPSFSIPLTPYLFRAFLAHDEEDLDLGRVLAAIWPAYLQFRARPDRELGLRPEDEMFLANPPAGLPQLFAHAADAFSLSRPRLFVRTDVPGGMAHLHALPMASLCGGTLVGFDASSMLHVLGYHLSLYRQEAYLIALAPVPQELYALLMAALHLEGRAPAEDSRVSGLADLLARHMTPALRETLRHVCGDLPLPGSDPRIAAADALARHRRSVLLTAVRAGYALSGNLAISDRMQRMMPEVLGVSQAEMLDDLVTYSVSPSWAALRKELGIAREPSGVRPPIGKR
jgi:hypothetical protein